VTTPVGLASFAVYPYVNAGTTKTEGVDVDLRSHIDVGGASRLTAELNYTHVMLYDETVQGVTYQLAGTHGPSGISGDTGNPKDRATLSFTWDRDAVSVTAAVNYIGPFTITDPSAGLSTCLAALSGSATSAYGLRIAPGVTTLPSQWYPYCSLHPYFETNLTARYQATDHLSVHGAITNLFNVSPPVDLQTYGGGGELAYDGSFYQEAAVGRFFLVGATYRF
jgi:iron complex outermembrane receptor protein